MVKIDNDTGSVYITNEVFTILAGDAATRCFGVKGMAGRSKTDGLFHLLRRESMSRGVFVRTDEPGDISVELHIVVEHGVNITALCESIISEVAYKVSNSTGIPVRKVDVFIDCMTAD
ncbi:MAG: Asp23/Gls24 family envelope stress response protein [Oscillospiraceae bacterium]|nr:Asp23/Gls24 family envelope stress response protein [Oscillospiraceae bacterium]